MVFVVRIVFLITLFGFSNALACSCDFTNDVEGGFDAADFVFLARVVEIDEIRSGTFNDDGGFQEIVRLRARIEVLRTYKGDTSNVDFIASESTPSACGLPMLEGDEYIFFADDILRASLCSASSSKRTAPAYLIDWGEYQSRVESQSQDAVVETHND